MPDLTEHREKMIAAVMLRHLESAIAAYPQPTDELKVQQRAFIATYRPYAEQDVDAIIAALR